MATPRVPAGRPPRIARLLARPQAVLLRAWHGYFAGEPDWVVLTTRGRKSGLPREVLLPCARAPEFVLVGSTYRRQSNWIRNIEADPHVTVSAAGWTIRGRAEIVDDPARKRALVTEHPPLYSAPVALVVELVPFTRILLRTVLRPLVAAVWRFWVRSRPVVLIRPDPPLV